MAEERAGVLEGFTEMEVAGIPVGAAITGGVVAGFTDGVISLIPIKAPAILVRGLAAWALVRWGSRFIGTKAAQVGALFITYDAVQSLFDFRGMISGLFKRGVSGVGEQIQLVGQEEEIELPPELLGGAKIGQAGKEGAKRGEY